MDAVFLTWITGHKPNRMIISRVYTSPQRRLADLTPKVLVGASIGPDTLISPGAWASSLELPGSRRLPLWHLSPRPAAPAGSPRLLSAVSKSPHAAQHYSTSSPAIRSAFTLITEIHKFCSSIKDTASRQLEEMEIRLSASSKWMFAELPLKTS